LAVEQFLVVLIIGLTVHRSINLVDFQLDTLCRTGCRTVSTSLDDWLTVHRSITLVDFQLDTICRTRCRTVSTSLDDWLTVLHRSITLVNFQLDAQNSYLFTYNTFITTLYMFRALPCSSSGDLRRNCIYAASSIVTL
jgi:hypothetical protein